MPATVCCIAHDPLRRGSRTSRARNSEEFRNASVTDIARTLSQQFSNKLDVLVPDSQALLENPSKYTVSLRLRDATAGELFNAMNRIFEAGLDAPGP